MDYRAEYQRKLVTTHDIAAQIENGWTCCMDIAASIPVGILDAMAERARAGSLVGVKLHTLLDIMPLSCLGPEAAAGITPITWFSGAQLRAAVNEGRADIMPAYYQDFPELFRDYVEVDALLLEVSPMDKHGFFSAGASGSVSEALIRKAKRIFLEVNNRTPRALYAPQVHISQAVALCENNRQLPVMPPAKIDAISQTIGGYITEEVPNGATIQLGIGAVPEAVGLALRDKHDLGIHTELFTDSMVELIECGAVTNALKPLNRGKTVATFAFGSQRMYDLIDDNPSFQMLPVDYVNNPAVIAQLPNFISVNAALEVDFFGQVCAESVGTRHVSGSGGQVDYVRGATHSKGGKSFIAFSSTTRNDTISKIKATLTPGAIVTTSKNDVDYIVTEYGVAKLRGKTLSQRVRALIGLAHPKFRDELTFQAKKQHIL